jgi:hypothetical protein
MWSSREDTPLPPNSPSPFVRHGSHNVSPLYFAIILRKKDRFHIYNFSVGRLLVCTRRGCFDFCVGAGLESAVMTGDDARPQGEGGVTMRQQMLLAIMIGLLAMASMAVVTGCYSKPREESKPAMPADSAMPPAEPAAPPADSAMPPAEPAAPPAEGGAAQ